MDLYPVFPEIMTEKLKGLLPFRTGELLAARVLRMEGEILHLLLDSGAVLKTRLLADIKLQAGEEMLLQVKGIRDGRIELSLAYRQQAVPGKAGDLTGEYGTRIKQGDLSVIGKLMENQMPVTFENIREVQRAVKLIAFLHGCTESAAGRRLPPEAGTVDMSIDRIVKWLTAEKEEAAAKGTGPRQYTVEQEKLAVMLEELPGAEAEDVIKLKKYGLKLSPRNLVLAKNLRENKGFPGILLKTFYQDGKGGRRTAGRPAEVDITMPERGGRDPLKTPEGGGDNAVIRGRPEPKAEPFDIKYLMKSIVGDEKASPRQRASAELLVQRAALLEKALAGQDLCVFPFLFDGQIFQCLVKNVRRRDDKPRQDDILELVVDARPPNLGSIRVNIRADGRHVEFGFFADRDDTKNLIERERGTLRAGVEKLGFRVGRITCVRMPEKLPEAGDVLFDVKV